MYLRSLVTLLPPPGRYGKWIYFRSHNVRVFGHWMERCASISPTVKDILGPRGLLSTCSVFTHEGNLLRSRLSLGLRFTFAHNWGVGEGNRVFQDYEYLPNWLAHTASKPFSTYLFILCARCGMC